MKSDSLVEQIKIRKLEEKDFELFGNEKGLWHIAEITRAHLEWLTRYRPSKNSLLVACVEDQPIGFYLNVAVQLKVADEIVDAYRGEVFVYPEHRRKKYNIFNLLVRTNHEEARRKNAVLYGFPFDRLLPYYQNRIGMRFIRIIPRYLRILNPSYILERFVRNQRVAQRLGLILGFFMNLFDSHLAPKSPAGIIVNRIHSFDERFDRLWLKASALHKIAVVRNQEYLNWAHFNPSALNSVIFAAEKNGEVLGYIVLQCDHPRKVGRITDLFDIQHKTVTKMLILKAVEYFKSEKIYKIECYLSGNYYESVLKSVGFLKIKGENDRRFPTNFIAISYSSKMNSDFFYDSENWFLTYENTRFA